MRLRKILFSNVISKQIDLTSTVITELEHILPWGLSSLCDSIFWKTKNKFKFLFKNQEIWLRFNLGNGWNGRTTFLGSPTYEVYVHASLHFKQNEWRLRLTWQCGSRFYSSSEEEIQQVAGLFKPRLFNQCFTSDWVKFEYVDLSSMSPGGSYVLSFKLVWPRLGCSWQFPSNWWCHYEHWYVIILNFTQTLGRLCFQPWTFQPWIFQPNRKTKVRFTSFQSGRFITVIKVNPLESKLA